MLKCSLLLNSNGVWKGVNLDELASLELEARGQQPESQRPGSVLPFGDNCHMGAQNSSVLLFGLWKGAITRNRAFILGAGLSYVHQSCLSCGCCWTWTV